LLAADVRSHYVKRLYELKDAILADHQVTQGGPADAAARARNEGLRVDYITGFEEIFGEVEKRTNVAFQEFYETVQKTINNTSKLSLDTVVRTQHRLLYLQKSADYYQVAATGSLGSTSSYADRRTHFLGSTWLGLLQAAAADTNAATCKTKWELFQDRVDIHFLAMKFKEKGRGTNWTSSTAPATGAGTDAGAFESLRSPYIDASALTGSSGCKSATSAEVATYVSGQRDFDKATGADAFMIDSTGDWTSPKKLVEWTVDLLDGSTSGLHAEITKLNLHYDEVEAGYTRAAANAALPDAQTQVHAQSDALQWIWEKWIVAKYSSNYTNINDYALLRGKCYGGW
jgi:hypothetical protein